MEELTGLDRRYVHLHTPKHLTNPDHLVLTPSSGGSALPIAERYSRGCKPPQVPEPPASSATTCWRIASWTSAISSASFARTSSTRDINVSPDQSIRRLLAQR